VDWSTGCVDMVAPDRLFLRILQFLNPKYMLFWRVRNIAFQKAFLTEQYLYALTEGLLYWLSCVAVQGLSAKVSFV
jgi:hypothetical protein